METGSGAQLPVEEAMIPGDGMLTRRAKEATTPWVFPGYSDKPFVGKSLNHQHQKVRALLKLPKDFVIHSLRHTMLTRLGEAGVGAFTIMWIAGHSSITVSQRYVHPTPEAIEWAFEKLEAANGAERQKVGILSGIAAVSADRKPAANALN
jgi:site-specific recombinase XerD